MPPEYIVDLSPIGVRFLNTLVNRFFALSFCLLFVVTNANGIAGGRLKAKSKSTSEIALKYYEKGVKASKKATIQEKKSIAATSESKKLSYREKADKQYLKAIGLYQKALHLKPNFASARTNLGHAFLKTGSFADALKTLDEVLNLDSENIKAQTYRDQALAALEMIESNET